MTTMDADDEWYAVLFRALLLGCHCVLSTALETVVSSARV